MEAGARLDAASAVDNIEKIVFSSEQAHRRSEILASMKAEAARSTVDTEELGSAPDTTLSLAPTTEESGSAPDTTLSLAPTAEESPATTEESPATTEELVPAPSTNEALSS